LRRWALNWQCLARARGVVPGPTESLCDVADEPEARGTEHCRSRCGLEGRRKDREGAQYRSGSGYHFLGLLGAFKDVAD
jgi:hypothetical protein